MIHIRTDQTPGHIADHTLCGLLIADLDKRWPHADHLTRGFWTWYDCRYVCAYVSKPHIYCEQCTDHPIIQLDLLAEVEL